MRRPEPVWECDYRHDRRAHRHRCFCCNVVLNAGDRVVMHRTKKGSRAAHLACADRQHTPDSPDTTREVMRIWGLQALRNAGWRVPELD